MRMRTWPAVAVMASAAAATACGGLSAGPGAGPGAGSSRAGTSAASPSPSHPHLAAADGAGATPTSGPPGVSYARVRTADGSLITVVVFHGDLRFVLHNGSQDPGRAAALVRAGPAVTGAERRQLLAAFNGGFMLRSRAGGYEQEGHVIRALRRGLASLVIDRSGQARIGAWGGGVPVPGEATYSVLQNLWPLVTNGKPTAETARWWRWGGTVGHAAYVARSAVGQTASGDLMYAASMSTVPADLAGVLAAQGARIAMELDINPFWVQLDTATAPGGQLTAGVPGQEHPAGQYLAGWTRDFIAVLAAARS